MKIGNFYKEGSDFLLFVSADVDKDDNILYNKFLIFDCYYEKDKSLGGTNRFRLFTEKECKDFKYQGNITELIKEKK